MMRLVLLCAAVLGPLHAEATGVPADRTFFALSVKDLAASVEWYSRVLDLAATHLPASARAQVALLQGDGLIVELVQHSEAFQLQERLPDVEKRYLVHGLFKAGFFVTDLDGTIERLKSRGATFQGEAFEDKVLEARTILMLDNSNNVIQLFERRNESAAVSPSTQ